MTHMRIKLIAATIAVCAAAALLAVSGIRQGGFAYYRSVDDFAAAPEQVGKRHRLFGTVSPENLTVSTVDLSAAFDLVGQVRLLRVQYSGVVPEMFKADSEVIVEGQLAESGVFMADTLITKCASKYVSEGSDGDPHTKPHLREETETP